MSLLRIPKWGVREEIMEPRLFLFNCILSTVTDKTEECKMASSSVGNDAKLDHESLHLYNLDR